MTLSIREFGGQYGGHCQARLSLRVLTRRANADRGADSNESQPAPMLRLSFVRDSDQMFSAVAHRETTNVVAARNDISDGDVDGDAEIVSNLAEPASHISFVAEPQLPAVNESRDDRFRDEPPGAAVGRRHRGRLVEQGPRVEDFKHRRRRSSEHGESGGGELPEGL